MHSRNSSANMSLYSLYCNELYKSYDIDLMNGTFRHCCKFQDFKVDKTELLELGARYFDYNKETLKAREEMSKGIKTARCHDCWDKESRREISWRQQEGRSIKTLDDKVLINLQVDPLCNQACFYCNHRFSTTIRKYNLWVNDSKGQIINTNDEYESYNFSIKDVAEFVANLESNWLEIGITGGEPFLTNNFVEDIELLINSYLHNSNKKVTIGISTNTNVKPEVLKEFYNKIENLKSQGKNVSCTIITSIENLEARAEYVRYGLEWENFLNNFHTHNEFADSHIVRMTFNAFTIGKIADFFKFFNAYNVNYIYNYTFQNHFRPNILDESFINDLILLEEYLIKSNSVHRFPHYRDLKTLIVDDRKNAKIFKNSITNIDTIRKTDWRSIFTDYHSWFDKIDLRD